jgi:hypothetical protein
MFYLNHFLFTNLLHQPYSNNNKTTSEEEDAMEVKHYVLKTINFFIPFQIKTIIASRVEGVCLAPVVGTVIKHSNLSRHIT